MVDARQRLNWLAPPYRPPDQTGMGKWGPVKQPRRGRQGSSSLAGKVNVPPPGDHPGREAFQHVRGLTHIQNLLLLQPTQLRAQSLQGVPVLCPPWGAQVTSRSLVLSLRRPSFPLALALSRASHHLVSCLCSPGECGGVLASEFGVRAHPRPPERLLVPEVCAFLWWGRLARGSVCPHSATPPGWGFSRVKSLEGSSGQTVRATA